MGDGYRNKNQHRKLTLEKKNPRPLITSLTTDLSPLPYWLMLGKDRETHTETETEKDRDRDGETDRQAGRQTDRDRDREKDKEEEEEEKRKKERKKERKKKEKKERMNEREKKAGETKQKPNTRCKPFFVPSRSVLLLFNKRTWPL